MFIKLTDSGLGGGTVGTSLTVNTANLLFYSESTSGGGSTLVNANTTLYVQEAPTAVSDLITDGNWLGFVPGWVGAPAGLVYVNMDGVLYFTPNLPTYHVPTGTTLYWSTVAGNYQLANTPDEVAENSREM